MHYVLSAEAEEDIIRIAEHGVRKFGATHARRYHDELSETLDLIARHPEMARERHEIQPPVRIYRSRQILSSTYSMKMAQCSSSASATSTRTGLAATTISWR